MLLAQAYGLIKLYTYTYMGCSRLELCRVCGEVLCGFTQFLHKNAGVLPKLDCNRLYPDNFQFIIRPYHNVSPNMSNICQSA
jgi:hypothetical protein